MKCLYFLFAFIWCNVSLIAQNQIFIPYPEGKVANYWLDGQNWVIVDTLYTTYNQNGRVTHQVRKDSTGQFITQTTSDWSNDPSWSYLTQDWENSQWVNRERQEFNYDSLGNKAIWLTQDWINGQWVTSRFSSRDSSVYQDSMRIEQYRFDWDTTLLNWKKTERIFYQYADSNLLSYLRFDYNDSLGWLKTDSVHHFYNQNGQLSKVYTYDLSSGGLGTIIPQAIDSLLDNIDYFVANGDTNYFTHWINLYGYPRWTQLYFDTTWANGSRTIGYYWINPNGDTLHQKYTWEIYQDSLYLGLGNWDYWIPTQTWSEFSYEYEYWYDSISGLITHRIESYNFIDPFTEPVAYWRESYGEYQIPTGVLPATVFQQVTVYPNPALDHVFISTKGAANYLAILFDLAGKQVLEKYFTDDQATLSLRSIEEGVYILRIYRGDIVVSVQKVMKL